MVPDALNHPIHSINEWLDVLKRIRAAGRLCQVYVTLQGALNIIRALGRKGFCFAIMKEESVTIQEANDLMKEMSSTPSASKLTSLTRQACHAIHKTHPLHHCQQSL